MRLFLINKKNCQHITEIMPSIKAIYYLEAFFEPYLVVEFIPNKGYQPGIILQAGNETIRRNYTFDDPNDVEELKKLIWKYLRKYHKVVDITDEKGCIKDFRQTQTNQVIQGWQAKKRTMAKNRCCKVVRDMVADHISGVPNFASQLIKHPVYRDDTRDLQNRKICKKNRYEECGNNFPPNSILFKRCVDEVTWLCDHGYPRNKIRETTENYREKLKKNILAYLKKNDMRVDKKILDIILSAGFFERVRNRMGNKHSAFRQTQHAVDSVMNEYDYYARLIEGFNGKKSENTNKLIIFIIITIIIFLFIFLKN